MGYFFHSKREQLELQALQIKNVELRIAELEVAIKLETNMGQKMLLQHSRATNKEILQQMKDAYWDENSENPDLKKSKV